MDDTTAAENKLYEVAAMHADSEDADSYKNLKLPPVYVDGSPRQNFWSKFGLAIVSFLVITLLVLVLIVQGITLHQVLNNPESTSETAGTAAPTGDTGALTGRDDTSTCNFTELLNYVRGTFDQSMSVSDYQMAYILNNTWSLQQNLDNTQDIARKLTTIAGTLSNLQDNSITTEGIVNDIIGIVQILLSFQNTTGTSEPKSCQDIKNNDPNSPSGYYHINSQIMYCEMGELCGASDGWTRVGYFDMTDATVNCPDGFKLYQSGQVRACGRPSTSGSCSSIKFYSNGISYSRVCGRVIGYQFASPDAILPGYKHNDIDSFYVDGVSITRGYPRQHVWTLINGFSDGAYRTSNCPCFNPSPPNQIAQTFVGNDYYCESGNPNYGWSAQLYTADPIWDGEGCSALEADCCSAPGYPWFNQTFNATTDYLELRVCGDQNPIDEDSPISFYELYIK